jgi:uncharacterized protein YkwD
MPRDAAADAIGTTVDAINALRKDERLPPVRLDEERSRACLAHARYLARNADHPSVRDAEGPIEDPGLPGATEAGRRAALSSTVLRAAPQAAAAGWKKDDTLRALLVLRGLKSVAAGAARDERGNWFTVLDLAGGLAVEPAGAVVYPAPGQRDIPLTFPGNELPDPVPDTKDKVGGFPVTVTFRPRQAVRNASATLRDAAGREVAVWFSSPEKPANPAYARQQKNTLCLIAKERLRGGTTYFVQASAAVDRRPWERAWSFTTEDERRVEDRLNEELLEKLNARRAQLGVRPLRVSAARSRGARAHAHYITAALDVQKGPPFNDEDPSLPGFSDEGRQTARHAWVSVWGVGPGEMADWLAGSLATRHNFLDPGLEEAGLGNSRHAVCGRVWVFDPGAGIRRARMEKVVLMPADGEEGVPTRYPRSSRTPAIPDAPAGFTPGSLVSARTLSGAALANMQGRLRDDKGEEVSCWLVGPETPGYSPDAVCLLPRAPLRFQTTYTASVQAVADGRPWRHTWKFTTAPDPEAPDQAAEKAAVRDVNACRQAAGLTPVTLDATLSENCYHHARYLARNVGHPSTQGLGLHNEDFTLPGYSAEGDRTGKASVITIYPERDRAVDAWVRTLYHRLPILDPDLRRVGFGYARHPAGQWIVVMDTGTGKGR